MNFSPTPNLPTKNKSVVALCGGVGGAKLAFGLYRILEPNTLKIIINTGDDFQHFGLHISPDIDTVTYTLAEIENPKTGWGRKNETWSFMKTIQQLKAESWFALGDADLGIHVERTRRLRIGEKLSAITAEFTRCFGINADLIPMSDDSISTIVHTSIGALEFQEYFVHQKCQPLVNHIEFKGSNEANPARGVLESLSSSNLRAVVICPSNPFLSIDPILSIPKIRSSLLNCVAPVVAVSPLINGCAVKGPTEKLFNELSIPRTPKAIAHHYGQCINGLIIDKSDHDQAKTTTASIHLTNTLMKSTYDKERLAKDVLNFSDHLTALKAKKTNVGIHWEQHGEV